MAHLVLRVHPDPAALLREAADSTGGFRMEGVFLAVRQGGIRDDIYRMAGEAGCPGWFDPPVVIFGELPDRIGATRRVPLTADERAVLLERRIASHGGRIFGRLARPADFVDPLDSLFGELVAEWISPDRFDEAVARAHTHEESVIESEFGLLWAYGRKWGCRKKGLKLFQFTNLQNTLLDLLAFLLTATMAFTFEWQPNELCWGLWVSSLLTGWPVILSAVLEPFSI